MVYIKQNWRDLPNETTPITASRLSHMETQFDEAKLLIDKLEVSVGRTSARIDYKVSEEVHYDVVTIQGLGGFKKILAPGFLTDGSGRYPRTARMHPKALGDLHGVKTLTSCEGGYNVDPTYAVVQNINIVGGVAYNDFDKVIAPPSTEGAHYQALALYDDGSMRPIQASDNKTAQQYVEEGVVDTYGYGPLLVRGGQDTLWYNRPEFALFASEVSARTMIGQTSSGDVKILSVHGKSRSYGISGKRLSDLCIEEGLVDAINLDGGGSTQAVWGGAFCHPSSDDARFRPIATAIAISAPLANEFDTREISLPISPDFTPIGSRPGASIRCRGARVTVSLQCTKVASQPAITNAWDHIVPTSAPFPSWLQPLQDSESRGVVSSNAGVILSASSSLGGIGVMNRLEPSYSARAVTGNFSWAVADTDPA